MLGLLALLALFATLARAELVLTDPTSEVYWELAVAAGDDLQVEKDSTITGSVHSNGTIQVKKDALVDGDASATGTIDNDGTITGTVTEGAAPRDLPELPGEAGLRALADRVFEGDTTFENEIIDDVVFVDGKVEIEGSLEGQGTILATRDIRLREDAAAPAAETRISLVSLDDIRIDKDRAFRGVLRAGRDVSLEQGVIFEGVIAADRKVHVKKESRVTFLDFDQEAPVITLVSPADGTFTTSPAPEIVVAWTDDLSGVDPASVTLLLDGTDVTAGATIGTDGLSFTPSAPLSEGPHTLEVTLSDRSGNAAQATFTFVVDSLPPSLAVTSPPSLVVNDATPAITVEYSDGLSGVDLSSLRIVLDGDDLTGCTVTAASATCTPPPLAEGVHEVMAEIRDLAGNQSAASLTFRVLFDETPPSLTLLSPVDVVLVNEPAPSITLSYGDDKSGVDPASLVVRVDNLDVSLTCTTDAGGAVCAPPFVGAGVHALSAEVRDLAGNPAFATAGFEVLIDQENPTLSVVSPVGTVIGDATPAIEVAYADTDSGLDFDSLTVAVDGQEITAACVLGEGSAVCEPPSLAEGDHTVSAGVADRAGFTATASRTFTLDLDEVPPTVEIVSPTEPQLFQAEPPLRVEVAWSDDDVGVDPLDVEVLLGSEVRTGDCVFGNGVASCELDGLAAGTYVVTARVRDRAGNEATTSVTVDLALDPDPPTVAVTSPVETSFLEVPPALAIEFADAGTGVDPASVSLTLDFDPVPGCSVGPSSAACPPPALSEGAHTLIATVRDRAGNSATATFTFDFALRDREAPELEVVSPAAGMVVSGGTPEIRLAYSDNASGVDTASLFVALDEVDVTAACDAGDEEAVCQPTMLPAGPHTIRAELRDVEGNLATATRTFDLELQLPLTIDEPASGALTTEETLTVRGTVAGGTGAVTVGEVEAVIDGNTWVAEDVPVSEGANVLTAVATSELGGLGTATVTVVRDTLSPRVVIFSPRDGAVVTTQQVLVTGEVNDPASSSSEVTVPVVRVGGVEAVVEQRAFIVEDFLLQPGENTVRVEALDTAGNVGVAEVLVTFLPAATQRIEKILGNGQTAAAGSEVAEPLIVRLVNFAGQPLAGRRVFFEVTRGNGEVRSFPDAGQRVVVTTDGNGIAEARFALGDRSGRGNHEVTVTSLGIQGEVVFCASAEPAAPQRIKRIVGNNPSGAQVAIADAEAPFPLLTQVFDSFGNPVAGVDVTYQVLEGGGSFSGQDGSGEGSFLATTDSTGKASAIFTLGPEPGINNNLVEATVPELVESGALFVFSGVAPVEAPTRLSGLVLDPQDQPVPGVTVEIDTGEIDETGEPVVLAATTDAAGRFGLSDVPVGVVHLEVDGSTAERPGTWPTLEFEMVTVRGLDNTLGMPIRLPPIDAAGARTVGGPVDVTIPMAGVPGAAITVFADSVTFPDGSKVGELAFTQVHSDKVPMVAPLGSDFMLAWTIQPPGVLFDPPLQLAIPNLGAEPGSVVDMFSFDHDLGEFVTAGTAAVSGNGLQLVSTPGSGISKSGWGGCVTPPPEDGDTCHPSACKICPPGAKRPVPKCGQCQICRNGVCGSKRVEKVTAKANGQDGLVDNSGGEVVVGKDQTVQLSAAIEANCGVQYQWTFGDGETSSESSPTHVYTEKGLFTVEVEVDCKGCPDSPRSDTLKLRVIEVDLEMEELQEETEPEPNEEEPGVLMVVNNDDDDDDGQEDFEQPGPSSDEDDLVELKITFDDQVKLGEVRLEAARGGDSVKVWEDETKSMEVELPQTWNIGENEEVPGSVWIEGVAGSNLQGVEMALLYTNDQGAEIEDKVAVTVLELDYLVSPVDGGMIGADVAEVPIGAVILYPDFDDPENVEPVADGTKVRWQVTEGSGAIAEPNTETEEGHTGTSVSTGPSPGASFRVEATLETLRIDQAPFEDKELQLDLKLESAATGVDVGPAATLTVQPSTPSLPADDFATVTLQADVRDASGNPVADGTEITWTVGRHTRLLGAQEVTAGGQAVATVQATDVPGPETIVVQSGSAIGTADLTVRPLGAVLSMNPASVQLAGGSAELRLTADASDGAEVFWMTSNGTITDRTEMSGGLATATLTTTNARSGPVVIVANVGFQTKFFTGEFVPSGTAVWADPPILVSDVAGDAGLAQRRASAGLKGVPAPAVPTTTSIHLQGTPGAVAATGVGGATLTEAYTFDAEDGGAVPGVVGGHPMALSGAVLSTGQVHLGASSLFFEPSATAAILADPIFDFTDRLNLNVWVWPDPATGSGNLISKGTAWGVDLLGDGRVEGSVGGVTVTSRAALVDGQWNLVSLLVNAGEIRLNVNAETAAVPFAGPIPTNAFDVTVGGGFRGYLDDLSFYSDPGGLAFFCLDGVDASGQVVLGPDGRATLSAASRGGLELEGFQVERALVSVTILPVDAPLNGVNGTFAELGVDPNDPAKGDLEFAKDVLVFLGQGAWEDLKDAAVSFVGGDPNSPAGFVASVIGGFLGIADAGALIKNMWRFAGLSDEEVNKVEVFFALVGIATTVAPHVDAAVSSVRAIAARIGNSPFIEALFKRFFNLIIKGENFRPGEVDTYAKLAADLDGADALKNVLDEDTLLRFVRLDNALAAVCSAAIRSGDEDPEDPLKAQGDCFKEAIERAIQATDVETVRALVRSLEKSLDTIPDAIGILRGAGSAFQDTFANMARLVKGADDAAKGALDADLVVKLLGNCRNICTDVGENAYPVSKLFDQLANVQDVDGFESLAKQVAGNTSTAAGYRFELEVANFCRNGAGRVLRAVSVGVQVALGRSDIDVLCEVDGKNVLYQAKRSRNAFKNPTDRPGSKLDVVKEWVAKAKAYARQEGLDPFEVRYIVPDEAVIPNTVTGKEKISILAYLRRYTGGIDIGPHGDVPF